VNSLEPALWSVKYHPTQWTDFKGQDQAISQLAKFAKSKTCPNMILHGPTGTGKTAAALLFSREFLGDNFTSNFKILNIRDIRAMTIADAKRTIQQLSKLDRADRDEFDEYMSIVYNEAQLELKSKGQSRPPNKSQLLQTAIHLFASTITVAAESVKILVLDEADALDNNMQQALRRTMEIYNDACRFILITTTLAGWSPAIISRSLVLRFPSLDKSSIEELIKDVAKKEGVNINETAIQAIARESSGDARYALSLFQIASTGNAVITEDTVYLSAQSRFKDDIKRMNSYAIKESYVKAREILRKMLTFGGYNHTEILLGIKDDLMIRPLNDTTVQLILDRISAIDFRIREARNPFIQLSALLASIGNIIKENQSK
jgi:replication factor C small subunit